METPEVIIPTAVQTPCPIVPRHINVPVPFKKQHSNPKQEEEEEHTQRLATHPIDHNTETRVSDVNENTPLPSQGQNRNHYNCCGSSTKKRRVDFSFDEPTCGTSLVLSVHEVSDFSPATSSASPPQLHAEGGSCLSPMTALNQTIELECMEEAAPSIHEEGETDNNNDNEQMATEDRNVLQRRVTFLEQSLQEERQDHHVQLSALRQRNQDLVQDNEVLKHQLIEEQRLVDVIRLEKDEQMKNSRREVLISQQCHDSEREKVMEELEAHLFKVQVQYAECLAVLNRLDIPTKDGVHGLPPQYGGHAKIRQAKLEPLELYVDLD